MASVVLYVCIDYLNVSINSFTTHFIQNKSSIYQSKSIDHLNVYINSSTTHFIENESNIDKLKSIDIVITMPGVLSR